MIQQDFHYISIVIHCRNLKWGNTRTILNVHISNIQAAYLETGPGPGPLQSWTPILQSLENTGPHNLVETNNYIGLDILKNI